MGQKNGLLIISLVIVCILAYILVIKNPATESNMVTIYVATDQDIAEPILAQFEKDSGVQVNAVYDTESTKSVGLVNKIMAEKNNPQADVFWNNEVSRTIILKRDGNLAEYDSPSAEGIPTIFIDANHEWTGFSARFRVLIYNTDLVSEDEAPQTLNDLLASKWKGKIGIANPLFGSTTSYFISLFTIMGDENAQDYLTQLQKSVQVLEGNSVVRDQVANGILPLGLVDSDDYNEAYTSGDPVGYVLLDQGADEMGTLVFPNTVMLIKNAPHPEMAKQLIDYLLSKSTESMLAESRAAQLPLHETATAPVEFPSIESVKTMSVDWEMVADKSEEVQLFLQNLFIQ